MLRTYLIIIKCCCQNFQEALISEKEKPCPFMLVFRIQAEHVLPNFVSVHLYTFENFSVLKQ